MGDIMADMSGHRARMRKKLADKGASALTDKELLEMTLYALLPRIDTKPLVKACFKKFKTLSAILRATEDELTAIKGLGKQSAHHILAVRELYDRLSFEKVVSQNVLNNWESLQAYCIQKLAYHPVEALYVILLNNQNRVIDLRQMGEGTINQMTVYPREILKVALAHEAVGLILVHNHPSGDQRASRQDIELTKSLQATLKAANITLHDHLIVAGGTCISMRNQGLFEA